MNTFKITRWTMGGLDLFGYQSVGNIAFFFVVSFFWVKSYATELNLINIDEEFSISRGVDVVRVKKKLFIIVSLLVGAVVSFTGPIGFVGIIGPHIARKITGYNHQKLIYSSVLTGGLLLVFCDLVARNIIWPVELPVGIITSIVGGPFFLWLLLFKRK